ncbi:MAG: DUF692 domain-containing protein [Chromatiales bacterium]|nr:DUF692 domain-containing protein [Chromatiales bacterium]
MQQPNPLSKQSANNLSTEECSGVGLGLRPLHLAEVLKHNPVVPWFEVHICNYLNKGLNHKQLYRIRQDYPVSFHGVNLNLGGSDPLDYDYINKLKSAVALYQPALISEHACFTTHQNHHFHDLMPIPYTSEAVENMASRIIIVQDILEQRILIENVSRYFNYGESELSEGEFLATVCAEAKCDLLVDLNNAYVNQHNLGEDLDDFIAQLPNERIKEIHLAGYSAQEDFLIDTHSASVSDEVWQCYRKFCAYNNTVPCLIEWDSNLPSFEVLMEQRLIAERIINCSTKQSVASSH